MDRHIENYIEMGSRQQMDNGNYEEAKDTFNLVWSLDKNKLSHKEVLIDMCRGEKKEGEAKENCENKGTKKYTPISETYSTFEKYARKEELKREKHEEHNNEPTNSKIESHQITIEQVVRETDMLNMSLRLRAYVIQIGIDVFSSKPDYRPDVNFEHVSRNIDDLISRARYSFYRKNREDCDHYLTQAEKLYSEVAIILPKASVSKLKKVTQSQSENNKPENTTATVNPTSYKVVRETDMLNMSLTLRAYVIQIGIDVFSSKPDYRPDVNFEHVSRNIDDLISRARYSLYRKNREDCDHYLTQAEKLYSEVAIILPKASVSKLKKVTQSQSENNKPENTTATVNSTSYKDFIKGDDADVIKCLRLAENALTARNFEKAERLIAKSERFCPMKNARELSEILEAAKKENNKPENTTATVNSTSYKDFVKGDDIDVTKCLRLAENALKAKNFKKAERLLKNKETDMLNMSLTLRAYVIQIGIDVFSSKPDYRPDVNFEHVSRNIDDLISRAQYSFYRKNREDCDHYLTQAEKLYSEVAIILPKASVSKLKKVTQSQSENNKPENTTATVNPTSYKVVRETDMLNMSLTLRAYVIQIGIDVFSSKPDYRPDVNFEHVSRNIDDLISRARYSLYRKNREDCDHYLTQAEKLYSEVAIILPKASVSKLKKVTQSQSENNKPENTTATVNSTSYKVVRETDMLNMSLTLRAYVIQIGIDVFSSKPDYRPDVNFEHVSRNIDDLISRARYSLYRKNREDCDHYLTQAEKLYSEVAIILPKASVSKLKKVTQSQSENNKPENTTATVNSTSYKDFIKGDDADVIKCLRLAENALTARNFEKAERLIAKSERFCPMKNARELSEILEAAKKENNKPENTTATVNSTSYKDFVKGDDIDVTKCLRLAENALKAKNFKKAERLLKNKETDMLNMSLTLRAYVIQIGIDVFSSKPDYRPDVNFEHVSRNIDDLISRAQYSFYRKNREDCDHYLTQAEKLYSEVAIILPKASVSKLKKVTQSQSENNKPENTTATVNPTSYKVVRETDMLNMSLTLRAYVIQIGIDVFSSKPDYRPDVNFEHVSRNIDDLISRARYSLYRKNREDCDHYLTQAEKLYSEVAIILPKASVSKLKKVTQSQSENNKPENTTATVNSTSYKDFIKGDDADVIKCLRLAENALTARNFEKAERLIAKSERFCPMKNARELSEILEAAKKENNKPENTTATVNSTSYKDFVKGDDIDVTKCLRLAENALKAKNFKKAERLLKNKETDMLNMSLTLRAYVIQIGIDVFSSKPDYRPDVNFEHVSRNIDDLISRAQYSFYRKNREDCDHYLTQAEKLYSEVAIILPKAYVSKLKKATQIQRENNKLENTTATVNSISYKDFIKGDDADVIKCLRLEENALTARNFEKAERLIAKSERFFPTKNARELSKILEAAKKENTKPENITATVNSTSYKGFVKGDDTDVVKCLRLAEKALTARNFEKAERLIAKSERFFPTKNARELSKILEAAKKENTKPENITATVNSTSNKDFVKGDDTDVIKCLRLAENALTARNFEKAERLIAKSERFFPTKNARELSKILEAAKKENNKPENTTATVNSTSYKDFVKGDDIDVTKCLRLAENALKAKNFKKAERFLKKSERICPTKNARELFKILEAAKKENNKAENTTATVNSTSYKDFVKGDDIDVTKCLRLAENALKAKNFKKAERFIKKSERICPTRNARELFKILEAARKEEAQLEAARQAEEQTANVSKERADRLTTDSYVKTEVVVLIEKEAKSCIVIAENEIAAGRFNEAKNFLLKSIRLYPNNVSAKELLEKLNDLKENYSPTSYNCVGSSLGNKDEADKCVQKAENEFAACRLARAKRLLQKAERLCPTTRAKDLLRQIEDAISKGVKDTEEGKPRKPKQNPPENQELEVPKRSTEPTAEQVEAVRRVKEGKDDYEILGVKKESNQTDVRKAFRRLTLLLHPDKNKAPGAKEAFMLASEAAARLKKKASTN